MSVLVVIPARAGSVRLPMKPLRTIAGVSLLHRTIAFARRSLAAIDGVRLVVATDDLRIVAHAEAMDCPAVMTDSDITSGSGRALAAARSEERTPACVVNLQGDAPFQPEDALPAVICALADRRMDVATPVCLLYTSDAADE